MKTSKIKIKSRVKGETIKLVQAKLVAKNQRKAGNKLRILQTTIGLIYFWFGFMKFFNGISPAESIAVETLQYLSAGLMSSELCLFLLAAGETVIGIMLIFNFKKRYVIIAALLHLLGTFSPMIIMPEQIFKCTIFFLSLTGQYIVKNLIIFSSLLVLYPSGKNAV